jgi:hypothetical protein
VSDAYRRIAMATVRDRQDLGMIVGTAPDFDDMMSSIATLEAQLNR